MMLQLTHLLLLLEAAERETTPRELFPPEGLDALGAGALQRSRSV
jgi:hypothetical protein